MKVHLLMVVTSVVLLFAPRTVSALGQDGQPDAAMSGHAQMQRNANESAQATTDVPLRETGQGTDTRTQNVSYGGVAAGQMESGGRHAPCAPGAQCRIYFGQ